jgi:hypothetical protein
MNPIGGYFELEICKGREYYQDAIRLNTGRNALEFIQHTRRYYKVYVPYFTCDVILEPYKKLGVNYEFYSIDKNFEPIFDYSRIKINEGFLYTNYFGLKNSFINKLSTHCRNLIIDNSQSFFSRPIIGVDTFYSARKFFGVPDGSYLYMKSTDSSDLSIDISLHRISHLLKRIELGAEEGYDDFRTNENYLIGQPIKQMSNLTKALLCSIDYELVQRRRKENFSYLHGQLATYNTLNLSQDSDTTPMVYPILLQGTSIKQSLISNKIFVATYWPNVLKWTEKNSIEHIYASNIIHLPIDQRYSKNSMDIIIKIFKQLLNEKME